jgi:uncharacterized Tic20 family protein
MDLQKSNQLQTLKQKLMRKEVSRNEFLHILGMGLLFLVGLGPIVNFLMGKRSSTATILDENQSNSSRSYGV